MKPQKSCWLWVMGLKNYILATWAQETSSHKSRIVAPIFTNKTSFLQESSDESNKILKLKKNVLTLGPRA